MMPAPAVLRIAAGFTMPADAVTQTIGIIAKRNAGKTHTGVVLTEELLDAGAQVVVVDPLGVWWGLRSSIDGKGKGYAVVVFGGDHGDLPLTEDMGAQIANAIVDHRLSAVLDLSALTKAATRRFAAAFFEQLYHAKGAEGKRTPLHLMLDEADVFAPQRVQPDETRMLGAVDSIVRRGRTRGFGVTMITQRPATISKDVFTQIEVLVALQLVSPQDRKAVDEWVQANGTPEERATFMASLASLQRGQAWVWSPSFLKCFQRVQIRQRRTFDSSRTPTAGEQPIAPPRELARVDLDRLQDSMKAALEKVKANDPELLKKRVSELERELRDLRARPAGGITEQLAQAREANAAAIRDAEWREAVRRYRTAVDGLVFPEPPTVKAAAAKISPAKAALHREIAKDLPPYQADLSDRAPRAPADSSLGRAERAILVAAAQRHPRPSNRVQLSVLSRYSSTSSSFANALGALRTKGYIVGAGDDNRCTEAGLAAAGSVPPIPEGAERVRWWVGQLTLVEGKLLEVIAARYPEAISKAELSVASTYSETSSSFANALGRLRTLGLVGRGEIRASEDLMGDG